MIRLHYSNRLENLIEPLAVSIADRQPSRPLEPISIIVPNRVVEQFVRYRVAEAIGVAANLRFPFLRSYLATILETADPSLQVLDADDLQLVLFECLRSPGHLSSPELAPVRAYLEAGSKSDSDIELRTMLLAGHIARLFREYSISRRPMLSRWRDARTFISQSAPEAELWQRHLWRSVFDANGRLLPRWTSNAAARWMMLPDAFDALPADARKRAVTGTLHVFDLSYMGIAFAEIFAKLGAGDAADIRIYALNPCLEFWEDVPSGRGIARAGWARRGAKVNKFSADAEDPFELYEQADNTALRLWGRPGREYIRLLNQLTECDFDPHFSDPVDATQTALLASVQNDILTRVPARLGPVARQSGAPDPSIRFLACPGIRREVEIAANEIQALVCSNDQRVGGAQSASLRFHEIALLIPDASFDEYAAHIETVFGARDIPVDIVNRRFAGTSRVAEAIDLLMRLPLGRFTRDEMVRLLTHPAIVGEAGDDEADPDTWRLWVEQLGVFFGADSEDLRATYLGGDLFHWDQALRRLTLGAFMAGERTGVEAIFDAPGGHRYLPFEVPQDSLKGVARLVRLARSLIAEALEMRTARMALPDWSSLLTKLVAGYIKVSNSTDQRIRDYFLNEIELIAPADIRTEAVGYAVVYHLATARVADLESRHGRFSGTGVAAGSFSSLRSIPFKVIFALGLGEGEFPARSLSDPLDLRMPKRQSGDVSATERDRYMFLETILAARERIYFSYVTREARSGDRLEPSTLIREVQFILRNYLDDVEKELTIEHRVSRYDLAYFGTLPEVADEERRAGLQSFDSDALRGARMTALRRSLIKYAGNRPLPPSGELLRELPLPVGDRIRKVLKLIEPPESSGIASSVSSRDEISLPLAAIRKYLECPLQAAARYGLGMFSEDDDQEEGADEPLEQSKLQRSILLREVFWQTSGDLNAIAPKYDQAFLIAQIKGNAPAGMFADAANRADHAQIERWIEQARQMGAQNLEQWQEIRIGRADEFDRADRFIDAITLDIKVQGVDGVEIPRRVSLYGTVRRVSRKLDAALQCVLRDKVRPIDFLPLFLNAIALAAAGEPMRQKFRAIVLGKGEKDTWIKDIIPMSRDDARKYLAALVAGLLSAGNNYFLPLEAVAKVLAARKKPGADLSDEVEKVRSSSAFCRSDSGPVRRARDFDAPELDQIQTIIRERYDPIAAIFEKGDSRS